MLLKPTLGIAPLAPGKHLSASTDLHPHYPPLLAACTMNRFGVTFLVCLSALSLSTQGQQASASVSTDSLPSKLDAYLTAAHRAYKFTGTALVAKEGKVLLHKAYGWRDYAVKAVNDTTTRFPILSITKSFTAMVMLKLQEQGKLSLKDKLSKYFPEFANGEAITLHHLITHSSGLYNYTADIGEEDSMIVCYPMTRQRVLDIFRDKPLDFKPGKGFSYNNSGFFLAGMVIEKVTGKPYEQVVRETLFEPLGMSQSGFDFNNLPAPLRAKGYQFWSEDQLKPYRHYDSTMAYAAGSIYSTTGDMYKWAKAIATKQILSAASWKQAFSRQAGDSGYGFFPGQFSGKRFVKHSGGYPGFMTEFVYYPKEDLTVILLNNYGNYDNSLWPLVMGCSGIVFNQPYDLWVARKQVQLEETVLKQYTGSFGSKKSKVTFFLKEGALICRLSQGYELPLLAENESNYYFLNFNTQFHFLKNSSGKVAKVIIHEHGQDFELPKIE